LDIQSLFLNGGGEWDNEQRLSINKKKYSWRFTKKKGKAVNESIGDLNKSVQDLGGPMGFNQSSTLSTI